MCVTLNKLDYIWRFTRMCPWVQRIPEIYLNTKRNQNYKQITLHTHCIRTHCHLTQVMYVENFEKEKKTIQRCLLLLYCFGMDDWQRGITKKFAFGTMTNVNSLYKHKVPVDCLYSTINSYVKTRNRYKSTNKKFFSRKKWIFCCIIYRNVLLGSLKLICGFMVC